MAMSLGGEPATPNSITIELFARGIRPDGVLNGQDEYRPL